jgi:hypothetical protein
VDDSLCTNLRDRRKSSCVRAVRQCIVFNRFELALRFPDLLEMLVVKENAKSRWRRLSGFASRGSPVRSRPRPPTICLQSQLFTRRPRLPFLQLWQNRSKRPKTGLIMKRPERTGLPLDSMPTSFSPRHLAQLLEYTPTISSGLSLLRRECFCFLYMAALFDHLNDERTRY